MLRVSRLCHFLLNPLCMDYLYFRTSSFSSSPLARRGSARVRFSLFSSFLLLPHEKGYVVIVALVCIPHDLGCVVETYWLPIGRPSSDASRRPSISLSTPPHVSHVPIIDLHDFDLYDFYDSLNHTTPSPAYTLHLLFFVLSFIAYRFVQFFHRSLESLYEWLPRSKIFLLALHLVRTNT